MTEKTANQVVKEFKESFGALEFKATNNSSGQIGGSKGWVEPKEALFEINGNDYLALGRQLTRATPTEGVISNILSLVLRKKT